VSRSAPLCPPSNMIGQTFAYVKAKASQQRCATTARGVHGAPQSAAVGWFLPVHKHPAA